MDRSEYLARLGTGRTEYLTGLGAGRTEFLTGLGETGLFTRPECETCN